MDTLIRRRMPNEPVILNGELSIAQVSAIAAGARVGLDGEALARVQANRETLEHILSSGTAVYGISTGFGALVSNMVAPELQRHLQVNLLRSHAAGTGEDLPAEAVRGAMAVRLNGLLLGHSGVRPVVLERVVQLLNEGFTPRVPQTGSLGASGDLAPSAHAFLPLLGEGEAFAPDGALLPGAEVLARLGAEPLALESKEGLALINGTHFMSAIGALVAVRVAAAARRDRRRHRRHDRRSAWRPAGVRSPRTPPAPARRPGAQRGQHRGRPARFRAGRRRPRPREDRLRQPSGRLFAALRRPGARRRSGGLSLLLRAGLRRPQRGDRQPARVRRPGRGDLGRQLPRAEPRPGLRHVAPRRWRIWRPSPSGGRSGWSRRASTAACRRS